MEVSPRGHPVIHLLLAADEGELAPDNVISERTAESGTQSEMRPSAGRFVPELQAI
jgi:hypothetical protein